MEVSYGFGRSMTYVAAADDEPGLLAAMLADRRLHAQVRGTLRGQHRRAVHMLREERGLLGDLASALAVRGTLGETEVDAIAGEVVGPE